MNKLFLVLALVLAAGSVSAQTNPFLSGSPDSGGNEPASVSSGSWVTSLPLMDRIVSAQRSLQRKLSELIGRISEEGDAGALFILLGLSFLYGVLHALGPGHRKTVLAGYFIGEKARPLQGALTGLILALVHAGSAVAVVGVVYLLAKGPLLISVDRVETVLIPVTSGLLILLGAWMLYRGIAEYRRKDTEDGKKTGRWGIIASGMFPCPGAAAVMLFAAAMEAFFLGVLAVAAMSAGMALVLAGVGTVSVLARGKLLKFMGSGGKGRVLELLLHLAGGGVVLVMGLFLLLASLPG